MESIRALQLQQNSESKERWELYASHRYQVTQHLISRAQTNTDNVCILGAGNCNDLALKELISTFQETHLIDLDSDSLREGLKRQNLISHPRIYHYGNIDISGILNTLDGWLHQTAPPEVEVDKCIQKVRQLEAPNLPNSFNVVASVCLLTQLIASIDQALGFQHPRFMELILAVRLRHLHLLSQLTAPNGWSILITDIVSSDTVPELSSIANEKLPEKLMQLIKERNFFHGVNPIAIINSIKADQSLASQISQLDLSRPWCWDFGPRTYAVCAIQFQKRAAGSVV